MVVLYSISYNEKEWKVRAMNEWIEIARNEL